MSSLQSITASSSFGCLRQKFTPEYLAQQLPVFQERVPRAAQESLKYPTDAPANLPLPPLLPGEELLLQQHRVACLDSFSELAVGSVYITNFRIIFNGNSISDPESRESILEGLPGKKDFNFSLDTGKFPKILSSRPSATFNSYLTNPEQIPKGHSKFKLNSLKIYNRSSSENNVLSVKKSGSLRRTVKTRAHADTTDGAGGVWSDISSVFHRGAQSLRIPVKRKGGMAHKDMHWDSGSSVSSVSENSEGHTTERELEQNLSPTSYEPTAFTIGSVETTIYDTLTNGSVLSPVVLATTAGDGTPPSSLTTDDSDPLSGSWTVMPNSFGQNGALLSMGEEREEVDFEKYSSSMTPIFETEKQKLDPESLVDPSRLLDPSLEQQRQEYTRKSWFQRSASFLAPDADADSTSDKESGEDSHDPPEEVAASYSKIQILAPKESSQRSESPVYSTPVKIPGQSKKSILHTGTVQEGKSSSAIPMKQPHSTASDGDKHLSPHSRKRGPPPPPKKPPGLMSTSNTLSETRGEECEDGGMGNGCGEGGRGVEYANSSVLKLGSLEKRERSISNPGLVKKPKPLPRKADTLDRLDSTERGFGFSLPADFKPIPVPRKSPSPSQSPKFTSRVPHSRPPVSAKPPLLPKPSPPFTRAHPPPPSSQSTPDTVDNDPGESSTTSPNKSSDLTPPSDGDQPVAPPRRKRKTKTTPTRQPLSPPSPSAGSPVKTMAVPSDAVSSDHPDTSSESDLSNPRYKSPPSSSELPRSPSPLHPTLSPEWQEESRNSSLMAQRHSIPSVRSSFPVSSLNLSSTYAYVGDGEPLPPITPFSTLNQQPLGQSVSPLPTSTRYSFSCSIPLFSIHSIKKQPAVTLKEDGIRLPEGIVVQARNFRYMKLHVHPHNKYDADGLKELLEKKILVEMTPQELFAFYYCAAIRHPNPNFLHTTALPNFFKLQDEMERMKLSGSQVWHVTSVLKENPDICPSYPSELIVPLCIPNLDIIRGAKLYRNGRFPTLSWSSQDNSVFLLRAAPTITHRGQSGSSGMCLDEAILQAVCVFTEKAQGGTKLYIFTEKPESTTAALSDPMHTSLTEAQKRAYYYHNCQFEYGVNLPTYKNIRHSFNKLSAVLEEDKVREDEFLIALDDSRWLYRVQELLQTASAVVGRLEEECASVLVSYDCGWDRTTQITSLAQLLLDPYYRTMDGFQVLVQKEWLWFGHPFQSRHTRRGRVKEDGPVFMQWVDCVWQVMQQCPSAFEFNEKFLMVLVESSYSGQFGTFLLNNEQERHKTFSDEAHKHKSVATHTLSFWTWVAMVNAAGRTFYNHLYDPQTFPWVIYPNCSVPCLKLWTNHYSQSKFLEHHSTTTPPLQKQLELLVRVYQKLQLSSQVDLSVPARTSPSPSTFSDDSSRNAPNLERERERVRQTGRPGKTKTPVLHQTIKQYLTSRGIDPAVCKHVEIAASTCQGYLVKLGGVRKNWQERWFVLDFASQLLTYFENKEAYTEADRGTPKGVIALNDMNKIWQNTKKKEHLVRHVFTVETKNRTYLFRAPSLITMELWMAVLNMPPSTLQVNA